MSQRRADALEHILGRFLAGKCSDTANGAHEVVVHIAHDALRDVPESSGAEQLAAFNVARGLAIDAHTARCGRGGERMDYNIAIDALCLQAGYT